MGEKTVWLKDDGAHYYKGWWHQDEGMMESRSQLVPKLEENDASHINQSTTATPTHS
jgi:hypothetical protein